MSQPTVFRCRTNLDLPDEIVLEILTWLPVKSLLRFRCVCKSWYSYITNPNFISTHLNSLLSHNHGYVIYMRKTFPRFYFSSHSQVCTVSCDRMFERVSEFRIPFTFQFGRPKLVGSCNGILCLTDLLYQNLMLYTCGTPVLENLRSCPILA